MEKSYFDRLDPQLKNYYELATEEHVALKRTGKIDYEKVLEIRAEALEVAKKSQINFSDRNDIKLHIQFLEVSVDTEIELRIYEPSNRKEKMPVILYFHGGGCIFGSAFASNIYCSNLSLKSNCIVISVDYRLAPENPSPAGQLDAYATWKWVCEEGEKIFGFDLQNSVFFGKSAGSNIALGSALRLLDDGYRMPKALVLLCPMLDDRNHTYAKEEFAENSSWDREFDALAWDYYVNGFNKDKKEEIDSYTAPGRREDFSGLPIVFTNIGELDLFRDDVIEFVRKLSNSKVPVEFSLYPGCFHDFENCVPEAEISKIAIASVFNFLNRIFN